MTIFKATYPATVTFNEDPAKRGVIRVSCEGLLGNADEEVPINVEPAPAWGWFYVPDIGEIVEIEVSEGSSEDEQHEQFSIDNLDLKWRSVRYPNLEADEERNRRPVNPDFTSKNYGKRRGFATPAGHVLMFDDTEGDESISLKFQNKDAANAFVTFDKTGAIRLIDAHGNIVELKQGVVVVVANLVEIAGKDEQAVLGTSFLPLYNAHTHPTPAGPSGIPVPQLTAAQILSNKVKVG